MVIKLVDELTNTKNKEKNQIIVNDICKDEDKLYKKYEFGDWVIQAQQRFDLKYTIDLILNSNKTIQLDLTWAFIENIKIKKWVSNFNWGNIKKLLTTLYK